MRNKRKSKKRKEDGAMLVLLFPAKNYKDGKEFYILWLFQFLLETRFVLQILQKFSVKYKYLEIRSLKMVVATEVSVPIMNG